MITTKTCIKCEETKLITDFHKNGSKHPRRPVCKKCRLGNYNDAGERLYTVYYLPEEHYVGCTGVSLKQRLASGKHGKLITIGVEVILQTTDIYEASAAEAKLHSIGYLGKGHATYANQYSKRFTNEQ